MRSILKFFVIALLMPAIVSCSMETDVTPKPVDDTPKKSYTVLYYSCSSNLDNAIAPFFDYVSELNIPEHINVVGQVKWDSGDVQRFVFDHESNSAELDDFANVDYRVDNPDHLADFITWARAQAPADEYIMVFCGHGNAYQPAFDNITRGILRDDNFPSTPYLGLGDICQAFDIAGINQDNKFALTMMICCLMNTLEYSTELVPYTDYYLASGHVTVATSKELYNLIAGLIEHGQDDEDAIVNSVKYAVDTDYAEVGHVNVQETTLTKSTRIKKLNESIKSFVGVLCSLYREQVVLGADAMQQKYGFTTADIDNALADSYYYLQPYLDSGGDTSKWYQCSYSYDIVDIARKVAQATNLEQLLCYAADIEEFAAEAILYQYKYNFDRPLFHGVTLVNNEEWEELRFDDANYVDLAFDKATGWSSLLKLNKAEFKHEIK